MDYLIEFDEIEGLTLGEILDLMRDKEGLKIKDVSIEALTTFNSDFIYPGTGVYIFRHNNELIYIGKASSMSFIERVPKHFDPREYAWMNRLLELVSEKIISDESSGNYTKALKYVIENFNLLLIHINAEKALKDKIKILENLLRGTNEPLNKFKTKRYNLSSKLD